MGVVGGDGTMMGVVRDAIAIGLNMDHIILCLLPYGTGNDFAKVFGWGSQPKTMWTNNISTLLKSIVNA